VNVVDFRDTDAAMTRFEYDIYPFGVRNVGGIGDRPAYWAPDRLINPNDGSYNGSVRNYVDVVWGMEQPELLLTESLAFHDKRIRDTDLDPAGKLTDDAMNPDRDYDQYRFPQGSLFLEMYATRSTYVANDPVLPGAPSSLYQEDPNASGRVKLDLSRRAPESADWGRQPVWRIGISNSTPPDVNNAAYKEQPNVIYQTADTRNGPNRMIVWFGSCLTRVIRCHAYRICVGTMGKVKMGTWSISFITIVRSMGRYCSKGAIIWWSDRVERPMLVR
jgi:hypothetical protein